MKTKKVSEKDIVMKVKKGFEENIAEKREKMNKTDKPLSPDLLRNMNAYWRRLISAGAPRLSSLGCPAGGLDI
jgi:hypothetical protein